MGRMGLHKTDALWHAFLRFAKSHAKAFFVLDFLPRAYALGYYITLLRSFGLSFARYGRRTASPLQFNAPHAARLHKDAASKLAG
jgi:hypothetical protein